MWQGRRIRVRTHTGGVTDAVTEAVTSPEATEGRVTGRTLGRGGPGVPASCPRAGRTGASPLPRGESPLTDHEGAYRGDVDGERGEEGRTGQPLKAFTLR